MPDLGSFSMSTGSQTSTGTTNNTSLNGESSSSLTTTTTTIQTSSPDGSDGLAATMGCVAIATEGDTLATGNLSGAMDENSVNLSATTVAASEDDETAIALTETFIDVSDGSEVLFISTVDKQSSTQNATGSTATSTSTATLSAYNIDTEVSPAGSAARDDSSDPDDQPQSGSTPTVVEDNGDVEHGGSLDGSFAKIEFTGLAEGENTFISIDANVLAIEGALSMVEGFLVLGVE